MESKESQKRNGSCMLITIYFHYARDNKYESVELFSPESRLANGESHNKLIRVHDFSQSSWKLFSSPALLIDSHRWFSRCRFLSRIFIWREFIKCREMRSDSLSSSFRPPTGRKLLSGAQGNFFKNKFDDAAKYCEEEKVLWRFAADVSNLNLSEHNSSLAQRHVHRMMTTSLVCFT